MPSYVGHFLLPTPTTVAGGVSKGRLSVCLSVYRTILKKKPLHLGSSNVTRKFSTMCAGKPFILGQKSEVKSQGTKTVPRGILHSCECWLLLVFFLLLFCLYLYLTLLYVSFDSTTFWWIQIYIQQNNGVLRLSFPFNKFRKTITNHYGGPDGTLGLVCVCQNNDFRMKCLSPRYLVWRFTWPFWVKFERSRSRVKVHSHTRNQEAQHLLRWPTVS